MTLEERVQKAIDLGKAWLLRAQARNGSFVGESVIKVSKAGASGSLQSSVLGAYALAACGESAKSASMAKALKYIEKNYEDLFYLIGTESHASYTLGLILMTIHEVYYPRTSATSQDPHAEKVPSTTKGTARPPRWVRRASSDITAWLLRHRSSGGLFGYPGGTGVLRSDRSSYEDISNTQFVLVGLWCASRMGHGVERKTLESMLSRLLAWQEPHRAALGETQTPVHPPRADRPRGFSYNPPVEGKVAQGLGSHCAAGVAGLAALKGMLGESGVTDAERAATLDQAIRDGLAWIAKNSTIERDVRDPSQIWHHVYLFGLAQALRLLDVKLLAGRDWYREGAEYLIRRQRASGSWPVCGTSATQMMLDSDEEAREFWDTCFALLFLCKP